MPSDSQLTSNDQSQHALNDAATPFPYRSSVRMLLGIPGSETAVAPVTMNTSQLAFNYPAPHSNATTDESDLLFADELLRSIAESEPDPVHAPARDSALAHGPPAALGARPEPVVLDIPASPQPMAEQPMLDPQANMRQPSIRQDAAELDTPPPQETSTTAEALGSDAGAIEHQVTVTIPGSVKRPTHTPMGAASIPVQPQSDDLPLDTQAAFADSRPPDRHAAEGQAGDVAERSYREAIRTADRVEAPAASGTMPLPAALAGEPGADSPTLPQQIRSEIDARPAHVSAERVIGPSIRLEAEQRGNATPAPTAYVRSRMAASTAMPADDTAIVPAAPMQPAPRDRTVVRAAANLPAAGSEPEQAAAVNRPKIIPASAPLESIGSTPALPRSVAAGWDAGRAGRADLPNPSPSEQIAQLQRTVAALAAQIDAQQTPPIVLPPAQPAVIVERATPPVRTTQAFWERSYLSRLHRWPRR